MGANTILSSWLFTRSRRMVIVMGYYEIERVESWLYSIRDPMNVFCYLAVGDEKALLYDTVYGIGDLNEAIHEITDKPVVVVLGHGHIDHANGAYQFESAYMHDADLKLFALHTSPEFRARNIDSLNEMGIEAPPGFDPDAYRNVDSGATKLISLNAGMEFDLGGGLCSEIIEMAGHTAGSMGILFRDKRTMLVSDAANAHVWMFLEESLPISVYAKMLDRVYAIDFDTFYTGHGNEPQHKSMLMKYKKVALAATIEKATPYGAMPELKPFLYEEDGIGIVFSEKSL